MIEEYEEYLYDENLDLLTKKFNNTHISTTDIKYIEDLFHDGIKSSNDILLELRNLKGLQIETLKFKCNNGYAEIPLKRIFGLANKDDTYFNMYDIGYHNPQYPLACFYLDLIKTLNEDLMWEEGF